MPGPLEVRRESPCPGRWAGGHRMVVIPVLAVWSGMASALLVGVVAGLYPALRLLG